MALPKELFSLELESQLLAGLLRHSGEYYKISPHIAPEIDFASSLKYTHRSIYYAIQKLVESSTTVDPVLVLERVQGGGISLQQELGDISLQDYLDGLLLRQVSKKSVEDVTRALKIKTIQRQEWIKAAKITKALQKEQFSSADEIIQVRDEIFSSGTEYFNGHFIEPENIFEDLEAMVEARGDKPIKEIGLFGPHESINRMYGSLFRPGNISVIAARSGGHKTSWSMDYCIKVADKHDIPVLHLDNGEMSKEELQWRAAASLSGVPFYLIESGQWRQNKETIDKVRAVWPRVKKLRHFYYGVGGKTTEQIHAIIQKFYLSKVGRDEINKMICCFDYLKIGGDQTGGKQDWVLFHQNMIKWKNFIRNVVPIGVLMPVQVNRSGIVGNKNSKEVVADESIIAASEGITFNASHVFILQRKTFDQLAQEEQKFGDYMFIDIKGRILGEGVKEALTPLKFPDGVLRKNWVNFDIDNFSATEKGTGKDVLKYLEGKLGDEDEGAPKKATKEFVI